MRKLSLLLSVLLATTLPTVSAQQERGSNNKEVAKTSQTQAVQLPAEIKLILTVEELPGITNAKSFWEGAYEIRVADWSTIVEKSKSGDSTQDVGEVLARSSFPHRSFLEPESRRLSISVPVTGSLLERLQNEAQKPQAFLLRSSIRLFDAQLDRNFALQVDRVWRSKLFPDGEAIINVRIAPDGGYKIWGPIPKKLPPDFTIVGVPKP